MLDYFALFLVFFVAIIIFYGIIVIHDIPYEIAVHRNHPHQDALHIAGWVSLFTLHVLWPFLWIWATLYREDRGWGFSTDGVASGGGAPSGNADLEARIDALSVKLEAMESRLPSADPTTTDEEG